MYLKTHARVVSALLVREMATRFGRRPGGYIWAFLEPAAHIFLLTMLFQVFARAPALGTSFPMFFATGYLGFQFYQGVVNYVSGGLSSNKALLNYPNVAPIDTLFARFLLQIVTLAFVSIVVLAIIAQTLRSDLTLNWYYIFESVIAASLLGLGTAMLNTVLFLKSPFYESLYNIISRPLFLLSGVFYLPDSIPHPFQELLLYNPLVHVTMLFRMGFYPEYRAGVLDTEYLYGFITVVMLAGMTVFTMSARTMRNA